MSANLVKLMSCRDAIQAETIRNRLETAGIKAVVQGAEVGTALSYVGVAIGYPNIEVVADDLSRARDLLAADQVSLQTAGAWNCGRCGEFNEPAFEVCWSCNKTRSDEDRRAFFDPEDSENQKSSQRTAGIFATSSAGKASDNARNPYQPRDFTSEELTYQDDLLDIEIESEDQSAINRAFIAAIFGCLMPIVFTIYSLWILIPISLNRSPAIQTRRKSFYAAWAINLIMSALILSVLLS
jgi:hypothetical protein